ncbi:T9SS type A sorting domain-containing protein [Hymenobacter ruricola]|uniref:T9SS type A sorting domain-containing protein n=1 Tax=Hymenobacter ruricola TaxID=2791023 RepID=UPI0018AFB8C7|nr:T9SS type A sorting domain-containing protein [Hymenobacter ruricola]
MFSTKIYLTRWDYQSPPNNPIAWDGLPGGTQRIKGQIDIATGTAFGTWWWFPLPVFGYESYAALADNFCFVPTASALDVPQFDNITTRASYISNVTTGPSQPLPVSFIAQGPYTSPNTGQAAYNFEHPRFPGRQAQWMFNEMENNLAANISLTCATECSLADGKTIAGPVTVCGPSTFTSPLQDPRYTYTWTATPATLFTVANGTGPTFQTSNASNGLGIVQLTISAGCAPISLFKDVAVGPPASPATQGPNWGTDCGPVTKVCRIDNFDPQATYAISVTGALSLIGTGVSSSGTYAVRTGRTGGLVGHIEITATNGCGTSDISALNVITPCGDNGLQAARSATLYPNPARETVDVHIEDADAARPVTVRLYDATGRPRAEQASRGAETTLRLHTEKLPAGLYFVHILRGGQVVKREQLQIEK